MNLAFKPAGLVIAIFTTAIFSTALWLTAMQTDDPQTVFEKSRQQLSDGNFRWAADGFRAVVSDAKAPATLVAQSIENAQNCYRSLQSEAEIDALLTVAVNTHPDSPEVLHQAAKTLLQANHYGQVFDQVFYRGRNAQVRVSGTGIRCLEQDRLQALRWLGRAIELSEPESGAELYITLARALLIDRDQGLAWRLQSKTDLALLPDYTNLDQQQNFPTSAAPVDQENAPLLYALPSSFEAAESDGERLHFALHAAQASTTVRPQALMMWASFLDGQFSVATLQPSFWIQRSSELDRDSMFALHTLEESETIAKLASGVQRFPLEEPFNFIAIYRQVLQLDAEESAAAARALVTIFQNRRQYEKAAEIIEMYPSWFASDQLDSIRGPRVAFDPMPVQQLPRPELSLVFRNAPRISFRARRVDFEKLLTDTKEFYRNLGSQRSFNSDQPGSSPPDLTAPSQFFTAKRIESYVQQESVEWREEVEPRPRHWDRRIQIQAPLENPGLYLIEATAQLDRDGVSEEHLARTLVWVGSTTLIRTQQANGVLWRCVDMRSGEPATNTTIEFFGWKFDRSAGRARTLIRSFAERTNSEGEAFSNLPAEYSWIAVSRSGESAQPSIAVMGWESFFYRDDRTAEFRQAKAFGVSERPVYRPGDEVKTKFWAAYVAYGDVEAPPLTHEPLLVSVWDPQGKTLAEHQVRTDEFGSFQLDFQLPASATLGHYRFSVAKPNPDAERSETTSRRIAPGRPRRPSAVQQALETSLTFRVEEYRKPEFEVSVLGPSKPVALGETVEARIQAKYFFGSPVTDADVRVVVERSLFAEEYFPPMPFDWCYGPGYWWLGNDYPWYPGWEQWRGCMPPQLGWFPRFPTAPPEVVLDQNLKLDANGEAVVKIDTALAKAVFGDSSDQRYQISVEVRDESRRTITANGEVIAARQPFKIYTWLDRGFYRVGDPIQVNFQSRMLDNTPVVCSGTLELLRISYGPDAQPIERTVSSFELNSDDQGQGTQMLTARQAGQYRVRLRMQDANGREVEGGYIFTVRGEGVSGDDFRYSGLELTPEKMHYQPGEKLRLQITADRPNALVALFVRPKEGVYPQPRYVQLTEKSQVVEIDVEENDQPNFFVEAYTVYDGQLHHQLRRIVVPPTERMLQVSMEADKEEYLPGEEATVVMRVQTPDGKPAVGSIAIAAFDRSLEQIAPDVLPPDIREFFWKWEWQHYPSLKHGLSQKVYPCQIEGVPALQYLGIFGSFLADDLDVMEGIHDRQTQLGYQSMQNRGLELQSAEMRGGGMMQPMAAAMEQADMGALAVRSVAAADAKMAGAAPAAGQEIGVRKNFADSAVWLANVKTNEQGLATARFDLPESLTSWRIAGWAVGRDTQVGSVKSSVVTRKPLLLRLQTPRFLVEQDEVVISAIVHNDTNTPKSVKVWLEIDGQTQLELLPEASRESTIDIGAFEQQRVDWRCKTLAEGMVTVKSFALADDASDAMQLEIPIVVHGSLTTQSWAGTIRTEQNESSIAVRIPAERRAEHSRLTIRLSPSLALSMMDSLPYLAEYPYGCTEQTLNRFLPAVLTRKVLQDMQIDLQALANRKNNLNAQELGSPEERRAQWGSNPIYDPDKLDDMIRSGLQKLSEMQNSDGGWGWFSGVQSRSSAHITALIVRGLVLARDSGVAIVPDTLLRGDQWLARYQRTQLELLSNAVEEKSPSKRFPDNTDALVLHSLLMANMAAANDSDAVNAMQKALYEHRKQLSIYGKSLLALATRQLQLTDQVAMLKANIEQFLVQDQENETAFLADETSAWYWYGSAIEANAMYLKLLAEEDPQGITAPRLVKYLLNNRKHASYWNSTRDTALVVEAFAEYLRASQETDVDMSVEVMLDDKRIGSVDFSTDSLFTTNNTIEIAGNAVPTGDHSLTIKRSGSGNLYWNVYSQNFSMEDDFAEAGLEVKVQRKYYLLRPAKEKLELADQNASVYDSRKAAYDRVPISELEEIGSGELVEVDLLIESKNDYEYLIVEDPRAAGLEFVDAESGYFFSGGLLLYRELREKKTGLCIEHLPRGKYSVTYRLRSETPGQFTALPATIQGMYAPELVGNSTDIDLKIRD